MSTQNYCADLPGDFVNDSCPKEEGGIIAAGYIHSSVYPFTDYTDPAEWTTNINNGDVKPMIPVSGTYAGPDWQTGPGYGRVKEQNIGADHEVTYTQPNINEMSGGVAVNIDFYSKLANASGEYYFYFVTDNEDLRVSTKPVIVSPKDDIKVLGELQEWNVSVKWSDNNLMDRYDAPTVTFEAS